MLDRSPGSGKDHIGYHALTQAAMRGLVRATMGKASRMGHLPGDHHFYVTFRTPIQGVQMDDSLKDKFPDEMTIVIQHQYWDFDVFEDRFQITLRFGGEPQLLRVPFTAVTKFVDPSTGFGVQLEAIEGRVDDAILDLAPVFGGETGMDGVQASKPADGGEATVVSLDAFRRK